MPTNEQRRETAKRKLERQLERWRRRPAEQRLAAIIGSVLAALVGRGRGGRPGGMNKSRDDRAARAPQASAAPETTANVGPSTAPAADGKLPPFTASANLGANCQYPAEGTASKPANAHRRPAGAD